MAVVKNKLVSITGVICLILLVSFAFSQEMRLLNEQEQSQLTPESLKHYLKGVEFYDKISYAEAIEEFKQAQRLCPECISLSFFLARLAKERAWIKYGEEGLKLYKLAASLLQDVIKQPNATTDDKERAQRLLAEVDKEIKKLENPTNRAEIEAKLIQSGLQLIKDKLKERFPEMFEEEEKLPVLGEAGVPPSVPAVPTPGAPAPLKPLTTISPQPTPTPATEELGPFI